jgi:hypothetical protein
VGNARDHKKGTAVPSAVARLTKEHLKSGLPRKARSCPVALACYEAGVPLSGVRADGSVVVDTGKKRFPRPTARMSAEDIAAVRFAVQAVDQGFVGLVEPFEFTLEWDT